MRFIRNENDIILWFSYSWEEHKLRLHNKSKRLPENDKHRYNTSKKNKNHQQDKKWKSWEDQKTVKYMKSNIYLKI